MEFFRQKYWSGLPFPSPRDLPNPGIETGAPTLQADTLLSETPGKPRKNSVRDKVINEKWFIRIGRLWSLQVDGWEDATPPKITGLQFYNQRKSVEAEKTFFVFLEYTSHFQQQPLLKAGQFSCPCMVKLGPQISAFHVCKEHVLEPLIYWPHWIGCGSHATTVLWFRGFCYMVLLLSKAAWLCG